VYFIASQKWFLVVLFLGLCGWLPLRAQTAAAPSTPDITFKAKSELVTVPVIVTDKTGAHIHGLKKEDFVLSEDGKPQKIATLEEVTKPSGPAVPPAIGPRQFSNVLSPDPKPVNLTILVLDLINTPFEDQAYAKAQLIKYLSEIGNDPPPTSILVLDRNGIKVIHDFATDPSKLSTALQKTPGQREVVEQADQEAVPAGTPPAMAQAMERLRQSEQRMESLERRTSIMITLEAMQQIAQSCAGMPGRKELLWASAGFPFSMNELSMVINIDGPKLDSYSDISAYYEKTWKALNQAQVSVYPVDVRGLTNPMMVDASIRNPRQDYYDHKQWMNTQTLATFQTFAQTTGGRAFYNTNDLKTAFQKAQDDNADYYMLSYYLDRDARMKTGWHKLGVKVHRDGTQVRARSGFFLTTGKPDDNNDAEVNLALRSPLNYTGVPITGHWQSAAPAAEAGKTTMIFVLTMPANFAEIDESDDNHMRLEFAAVALSETGSSVGQSIKTVDGHPKGDSLDRIRTHGVDYRGALVLPPGQYTVRFAVRDRLSGRMGSVSTAVKVAPCKDNLPCEPI
jgi:VWFA-related protein